MTLTLYHVDTPELCRRPVEWMLPQALSNAVRRYLELSKIYVDEGDMKALQQHQTMCKAALQHVEMLMKMIALTDNQETEDHKSDVTDLMAKAGDELKAYQFESSTKTKGDTS